MHEREKACHMCSDYTLDGFFFFFLKEYFGRVLNQALTCIQHIKIQFNYILGKKKKLR